MEPASEAFCEVMALVSEAVMQRRSAKSFGGDYGLTLKRRAAVKSIEADVMMRRLVGSSPALRP